jgi:putative PEP-CTERM system histidine kinase
MTTIAGTVTLAACVAAALLAVAAVARGPRGVLQWSFAAGMGLLALECVATHVLLMATEEPADRLLWLQIREVLATLALVPWGVFASRLAFPDASWTRRELRLGLGLFTGLGLAAAAVVVFWSPYQASEIAGPFHAAQLDLAGRYATIYQLLATVAILAALEVGIRNARAVSRWRIKYLVVGVVGLLLARFYFASQTLLFQVILASYLSTQAATILPAAAVIGASLLRARLRESDIAPSRQVLYRSVAAGVLGLYLVVVGALGWLLNRLGISEQLFWGSFVVFVTAIGLAVVLLSEDVRWRVKRFLGRHFYPAKYDYREQWLRFTGRLTSRIALRDIAPELLETLVSSVGAVHGVIFIVDEREGYLDVAASMGSVRPVLRVPLDPTISAWLLKQRGATLLPATAETHDTPPAALVATLGLPEAILAAPLTWRDSLEGLLVLGPERTGAPYGPEDLELVSTVADQAAGTLVSARLSERLAQAREFEAFHRVTSFVLHDLKNAISALSLLAQNAERNFDDPEFQRDALKTLGRTVDRMKALMARLSSSQAGQSLDRRGLNLSALVAEGLGDVKAPPGVTVVRDLQPVPTILGDADALRRVLANLVTNAFDAVGQSGVVSVGTHEADGHAVLTVSDTGCGIPEEFMRESLFTAFRTTKRGGWGIGLFQVKALVEAHGGAIDVESKVGKGTTFTVRIPHGTTGD